MPRLVLLLLGCDVASTTRQTLQLNESEPATVLSTRSTNASRTCRQEALQSFDEALLQEHICFDLVQELKTISKASANA